ncbi:MULTISPECIES: DUF6165 family protein [Halomonadaceae]|jgi:regulator of replication initiation timing|uniref:Uncharacterized protein n=1 Tax=Vreelandella halophila TaxID=86177 RepID=A0A9X4YAH6_9GAMM|nr:MULTISPECIES: DUF6165 family protein [Halomonas]MYL26177.1 hypothetical protein [Halomonas utahensis]MYL73261.1 hypothetical protein [Halomonas sp. 22501_18_FS]
MTDTIRIPVSFGEVLDKITILEIKSERIEDADKLQHVHTELEALSQHWQEAITEPDRVAAERRELKAVNEKLWEIEDAIREEEAAGRFGERFIELARSVYFTNDERAALKKRVNLTLGSRFVEEKSYRDYSR